MSQLILSRGNAYKRSFLNNLLPKLRIGPYFLVVSLILFVALITIFTLIFSTRQVTKGYVLNKLESEHQELIRESERQEMQISQVRSLNFIKESSKVQSMKRPAQVVFVDGERAIASR